VDPPEIFFISRALHYNVTQEVTNATDEVHACGRAGIDGQALGAVVEG
jgi:hypothetical protein